MRYFRQKVAVVVLVVILAVVILALLVLAVVVLALVLVVLAVVVLVLGQTFSKNLSRYLLAICEGWDGRPGKVALGRRSQSRHVAKG